MHDYKNFTWPDFTFCNPSAPFYLENNSLSLQHWQNISSLSRNISKRITKGVTFIYHDTLKSYTSEEDIKKYILMSSIQPSIMYKNLYKQSLMSLVAELFIPEGSKSKLEYHGLKTGSEFDRYVTSLFVLHGYNIPCYTIHAEKFTKERHWNDYIKLIFSIKFNFQSHLNYDSYFNPRSVMLYVHEPGSIPGGKAISLLPGYQHILEVTETFKKNLEIQTQCRIEYFTVELYDTFIQKPVNMKGVFKDCKNVEKQKVYVKACNCYSADLPIYKSESQVPKLCLNATFFNDTEIIANVKCMSENNGTLLWIDKFPEQIGQCRYYKKKKCNRTSYHVDHNQYLLTALSLNNPNDVTKRKFYDLCKEFYNNSEVKDDCFLKLKNDYVLLEIERKSSLVVYQIEESEYPISNLISDIGGLMGFWLGMSVVGLFKVFGIYLKKLYLKIRKIRKHTEIENKNQDSVEVPGLASNE